MKFAIFAMFMVGSIVSFAGNGGAQIVVQTPVRISPRGAGPHFWWTINASPSDPKKIVACALRNRSDVSVGLQGILYGSEDGGQTWKTLYVDNAPTSTSEVSCVLGADRTVYYIASNGIGELGWWAPVQHYRHQLERMHLLSSTDFGGHWSKSPPDGYADSAALVVDPGKTQDRDRVLFFADLAHNKYARAVTISPDGGRSIGPHGAITLPAEDGYRGKNRIAWSGAATRLPNGLYGGIYTDHFMKPEPGVKVHVTLNRVTANGVPVGKPIVVAAMTHQPVNIVSTETFSQDTEASIATGVLPHSTSQRVYAVWHDSVGSAVRVFIASSNDSGVTWTPPRRVDDLNARVSADGVRSASHASVAVNAAGVVGVEWAELDGRCWRFAASFDGGKTFGRSVPVNPCAEQPIPYVEHLGDFMEIYGVPQPAVNGSMHLAIGDWRLYEPLGRGTALTPSGNSFYAVWAAFGNGDDALYETRIDVNDPEVTALAEHRRSVLADASLKLLRGSIYQTAWVNLGNLAYDEGAHEFTITAVLVKPRAANATWPVVVRAKTLKSLLGPLQAVNSDNGVSGRGAAWVFDGPARDLPSGSMAAISRNFKIPVPLDYSIPRTLRFRVVGPPRDGRNYYFDRPLLDADFHIFTRPKT